MKILGAHSFFLSAGLCASTLALAPAANAASWHSVGGCANSIAATNDSDMFAIGCTHDSSGIDYYIEHYAGAWTQTSSGSGSQISVGRNGSNAPTETVAVVNHEHQIWIGTQEYINSNLIENWNQTQAPEACGASYVNIASLPNTVYSIGCEKGAGVNNGIYAEQSFDAWVPIGGAGVAISPSPDQSSVWVINAEGTSYTWTSPSVWSYYGTWQAGFTSNELVPWVAALPNATAYVINTASSNNFEWLTSMTRSVSPSGAVTVNWASVGGQLCVSGTPCNLIGASYGLDPTASGSTVLWAISSDKSVWYYE